MSIPTATSVPGAELVIRAGALAPDPATLVVVNCAGRTRQHHRDAVTDQRRAAEPGGGAAQRHHRLDPGRAGAGTRPGAPGPRRAAGHGPAGGGGGLGRRRKAGVGRIGAAALASSLDRGTRTVYRFDVRTPEDYAAGHLAGFRSAPGGQLVQETDWFAPVRGP